MEFPPFLHVGKLSKYSYFKHIYVTRIPHVFDSYYT